MRLRRSAVLLAVSLGLTVTALPGLGTELVPVSDVVRTSLGAGVSALDLAPGTQLLGLTWASGTPEVAVRWHGRAGWTSWQEAEADAGPDAESAEGRRARAGTEPLWVPSGADRAEIRSSVAGTELVVVRERQVRRWRSGTPAHATVALPRLGDVVTRAEWGANEKIRGKTEYGPRPVAAVVHHTVNSNSYTQAEAAGLVRGIYAYHVQGRGWDDIAYHLVVDRFGRVFEGRYGALAAKPVVGAHTAGFNTATVGIAMLGDADVAAPAQVQLDRIAAAGAWAADRWGFDPRTSVTLTSRGSPRFKTGTKVSVPRMPGHRDLGQTACPGRYAYPQLPALRDKAWSLLAPVFTAVSVQGPARSSTPARVAAVLTDAASWQVTVKSALGLTVKSAAGDGRAVELNWDGTFLGLPVPGSYTWTMTADDGVHGPSEPVSGTVEATL